MSIARFLLLLALLPAVTTVSASTGTRLNKTTVSDMATYHYERGLKAAAKAEEHLAKVDGASADEIAKLEKRAEKEYRKAMKLYERALRVNDSHRGAKQALADTRALLDSSAADD